MTSFNDAQILAEIEKKRFELITPEIIAIVIRSLKQISPKLIDALIDVIEDKDPKINQDELLIIWSCLNEIEPLFKSEIIAIKLSLLKIDEIKINLPVSERNNHLKYLDYIFCLTLNNKPLNIEDSGLSPEDIENINYIVNEAFEKRDEPSELNQAELQEMINKIGKTLFEEEYEN